MFEVLWHKTLIYTNQQNGLVKKITKTLIKKVRHIPLYSKLPKTLWVKALNATCYPVNKIPLTALGCKTLIELLTRKFSNYSKLRIFSCLAYTHVKQDKLEPRL